MNQATKDIPMHAFFMIPLLMLAVPDRPNPTPDAPKSLADQLKGDWKSVKLIIYGNISDQNIQDGDYTAIDAGRWVGYKQGIQKPGVPTTYTIDATKKPATIDFVVKQGATDFKLHGIFKIEGDLLTVCYAIDSVARPTEFVSTQNSQSLILEMKRYKR